MAHIGQIRPGVILEDLRAEFALSPERMQHISWLVTTGMLNHEDIRKMLLRQDFVTAYGLDTKEWPSLTKERSPPRRRVPAPAFAPPVATHRGEGSLPQPRVEPEVVVLDWG